MNLTSVIKKCVHVALENEEWEKEKEKEEKGETSRWPSLSEELSKKELWLSVEPSFQ
jgi:hypothetical protein